MVAPPASCVIFKSVLSAFPLLLPIERETAGEVGNYGKAIRPAHHQRVFTCPPIKS